MRGCWWDLDGYGRRYGGCAWSDFSLVSHAVAAIDFGLVRPDVHDGTGTAPGFDIVNGRHLIQVGQTDRQVVLVFARDRERLCHLASRKCALRHSFQTIRVLPAPSASRGVNEQLRMGVIWELQSRASQRTDCDGAKLFGQIGVHQAGRCHCVPGPGAATHNSDGGGAVSIVFPSWWSLAPDRKLGTRRVRYGCRGRSYYDEASGAQS